MNHAREPSWAAAGSRYGIGTEPAIGLGSFGVIQVVLRKEEYEE